MRYFTTSRGIKFVFADYEDGTEVGAIQVATIGDLRELLTFIDEETSVEGPQLVRERPTLLLNGSGLDVSYDTTLPHGAIHFIVRGSRWVLEAGGTDLTSTSPLSNAPEGGAGGSGDEAASHQ